MRRPGRRSSRSTVRAAGAPPGPVLVIAPPPPPAPRGGVGAPPPPRAGRRPRGGGRSLRAGGGRALEQSAGGGGGPPAGAVVGDRPAVRLDDHGEKVAPDAGRHGFDHAQHGIGGDRRVDGAAPRIEDGDRRPRRERMPGRHHAMLGADARFRSIHAHVHSPPVSPRLMKPDLRSGDARGPVPEILYPVGGRPPFGSAPAGPGRLRAPVGSRSTGVAVSAIHLKTHRPISRASASERRCAPPF